MHRTLPHFAVAIAVSAFSSLASANVIFSQPPVLNFGAVASVEHTRLAAPFVSPSTVPMTGISFWCFVPPPELTALQVDFYAEQPGGGVGAALFGALVPFASMIEEPAGSDIRRKFTYTLPSEIALSAGERYFLGLSGGTNLSNQFAWGTTSEGEEYWVSFNGAPFIERHDFGRVSFEILGDPTSVIPLPSGAAMGLAGFGALASFRRRR